MTYDSGGCYLGGLENEPYVKLDPSGRPMEVVINVDLVEIVAEQMDLMANQAYAMANSYFEAAGPDDEVLVAYGLVLLSTADLYLVIARQLRSGGDLPIGILSI